MKIKYIIMFPRQWKLTLTCKNSQLKSIILMDSVFMLIPLVMSIMCKSLFNSFFINKELRKKKGYRMQENS